MSDKIGLADRENYEAFSKIWRSTVLEEAGKWCSSPEARDLLAEAVLSEFRKNYENRDPPNNPGFYLRGQVCLIYSITGQNIEKLKNYIAEHGLPSPPEMTAEPEKPIREPEEAEAPPLQQEETPADKASPLISPVSPEEEPGPEEKTEAAGKDAPGKQENTAPAETAKPKTDDAQPKAEALESRQQKPPAVKDSGRADTFYDPVRTTLWTPNGGEIFHTVQEVELPDKEEEERSTGLSFLNTILFLLSAASFAFCVYESGLIQHLLH